MARKKLLLGAAALIAVGLYSAVALDSREEIGPDGWATSNEALAKHFLRALAENDREAIVKLSATRGEWEEHVWPHQPASRPGTNFTADFVWENLAVRSRSDLAGTLARYGGRQCRLVDVRFADETRDYGVSAVHRDARLRVRDGEGRLHERNLFGSVLEKDGRFKILSFIVR